MKDSSAASTSSAARVRYQRKPQKAEQVLESTLRGLRLAPQLKKYEVFQRWPEIIGPELAKVAKPEKITRSRILVIRVLDGAWVQEIALRKSQIISAFQRLSSGSVIEDIRFVVSSPVDFRE